MIQSKFNDKVYWIPGGAMIESRSVEQGWYFYDKDGYLGCTACKTEKEALVSLLTYETERYKNIGMG